MNTSLPISDTTIWFKHIKHEGLRRLLSALGEGEAIFLDTDGVVGRWVRMEQGHNSYATPGIKPDGAMRDIWYHWFSTRRGEVIQVRTVELADDYLAQGSILFSEWNSPEDEEAFRDL